VGGHDRLGDREAETDAGNRIAGGGGCPEESRVKLVELRCRNTDSGITHGDYRSFEGRGQAHRHHSVARGELEGVGNEIVAALPEPNRVAANGDGLKWTVEYELDTGGIRRGPRGKNSRRDHLTKRYLADVKRKLTRTHLGGKEQIADQAQ
jgi:hypothetical protein